jgi:AraC-like DNA-binding protein/ligand-binding sensor protein
MSEKGLLLSNENLNIDLIKEKMDAFSVVTNIPVTIMDESNLNLLEVGEENKICKFFDDSSGNSTPACRKTKVFSIDLASKLGEPYIYVCPSGFINIVVAIIKDKKIKGSIIAGPIAMGQIVESTIKDLFSIHEASPEIYSKVSMFLRNIDVFSPEEINKLAILLNSLIMSLYSSTDEYEKLSKLHKEQSEINENIQEYKKQNKDLHYPYEKEKLLIEKVKEGDNKGAKEVLNSLLSEILLIESGNIEIIKARILELCTIISRASVEGGASLEKVFGLNFDFINSLNKIDSINELCTWTVKITDHFVDNVFGNIYSGNSYLISQAVQSIKSNYMNKLSLEKLADYLHINPSYLSKLFKKEMDMNFSDYLNKVRIDKSKELLTSTDMSILDIALYTGYEDQSYFTKVFKKYTDTTPHKYRKSRS